jgi:cobalamin biosynthetic protein CobC
MHGWPSAVAGWWWTKRSWTTPAAEPGAVLPSVGLIVLRSFGKFFGLAGVRLGFVLAERKLLKLLAEQVGPWAVSGPTRVVGQACLRCRRARIATRAREVASERLAVLLEQHGFKPDGGCALFQWLITERAEACMNSWPGAAFCCACSRTTAVCVSACLPMKPTGCVLPPHSQPLQGRP